MSKVLISAMGSRGDAEPCLALAVQLKALGHQVTLSVSETRFRTWISSYGIDVAVLSVLKEGASSQSANAQPAKISKAVAMQFASMFVRKQFELEYEASKSADLILSWGPFQYAARSIAEARGIPIQYACFSTVMFPSWNYPPMLHRPTPPRSQSLPRLANAALWAWDDWRTNSSFLHAINQQRKSFGLSPIPGLQRYMITNRPWLAADLALGPAASTSRFDIFQTGAWLLRNPAPLPADLETFLANGDPPIFFGFGSTAIPGVSVGVLVAIARKLGRRVIVSRGWARLELADAGDDCLAIDDVDYAKLFPRVAAIIHHGGAGTTTAAALSGKPQIVVPSVADQFYWANRVKQLGIGVSIRKNSRSISKDLENALRACLQPQFVATAQSLAGRIERNGASIAARKLSQEYLSSPATATQSPAFMATVNSPA